MINVFRYNTEVLSDRYRSDIDGLRAIAVLSVLLFHAKIPGFGGGFVGVDVFFVISGFLITSVTHRQIVNRTFSIRQFYERRIRRIFPALFLVIAVCAPLGFFTLFPVDYRDFGQSTASTAIFSSNFLFWMESGYFAGAAEVKPLLHTWSLAVEEQYYVLFPLILLALMRWRPYTFAMIIAMWVVSFAWSSYLVGIAPEQAFYLAPSRAWELLTGAIVALYARPMKPGLLRGASSIAGFVSIGLAVVLYSRSTPFPGLAALLPCLGTAALLWSGMENTTLVGRLLMLNPLVGIGLISYSLYLWHWPMLILLKYFTTLGPDPWMNIAALALSFLTAWLSWRYVEKPFRGPSSRFNQRQIFSFALAVTIAAFVCGSLIHLTKGFPQRFSPQVLDVYAAGENFNKIHRDCIMDINHNIEDLKLCHVGQQNSPRAAFFVWGDSHANALLSGFDQAARRAGLVGEAMTRAACPPILEVDEGCLEFNNAALGRIKSRKDVEFVTLAAHWSMYIENGGHPCCPLRLEDNDDVFDTFSRGMAETIDTLKGLGKSILIIGPVAEVDVLVPVAAAKALYYGRDTSFAPSRLAFQSRQRRVLKLIDSLASDPAVTVIQPSDLFCDETVCHVLLNEGSIYTDDNHLSIYGSELLAPVIYQAMMTLVPEKL